MGAAAARTPDGLPQRAPHRPRMKVHDNRAWLFLLPVVVSVAFSAVLPLMTILNYSVQDILGPTQKVFVGAEWYKQVLRDGDLHSALGRQLVFSLVVLAIEIPLGVAIALGMPRGRLAGVADPGAAGHAAADPLERGGHHLADLRPRGHRPVRPAAQPVRGLQLRPGSHRRLADGGAAGRVALDAAARAAVLRRPARHSRCLLPGGAHRRCLALGRVPSHRAAQDAGRADHRRVAAFHGQLHDLHRAVRAHRRRPGKRDHVPVAVPDPEGGRAVRPGPGGGVLRGVFPDHPAVLLRALRVHAARRDRRRRAGTQGRPP